MFDEEFFYCPLNQQGFLRVLLLFLLLLSWGWLVLQCTFSCRALRVRKKMCGKGKVIFMIGDILCENVSVAWLWVYKNKKNHSFSFLLLLLWVMWTLKRWDKNWRGTKWLGNLCLCAVVDYFCFLAVAKKCREKILFTCSFMKGVWLFFFFSFFFGGGGGRFGSTWRWVGNVPMSNKGWMS